MQFRYIDSLEARNDKVLMEDVWCFMSFSAVLRSNLVDGTLCDKIVEKYKTSQT